MTTERPPFRRIVVGFQQNTPARTMRLAVDLAGLLRLDLFGLFVADRRLLDLGQLPFAREYRPPGGGWHAIDAARLSREMEFAGKLAERLFAEAAKNLRTVCRFEVVKGTTAEAFGAVPQADDIVMILEPGAAAEQVTEQLASLTEAAFRSAAAVMLVPPEPVRSSGPIVAVAAAANDPSIRIAAQIGAVTNEDTLILDVAGWGPGAGVALQDAAAIGRSFGNAHERMIVMTRGTGGDQAPTTIAAMRRVPVLVVEPGEAAPIPAA